MLPLPLSSADEPRTVRTFRHASLCKEAIEDYWRNRGFKPPRVDIKVHSTRGYAIHVISSDMKNGWPPDAWRFAQAEN